MQLLWIDVKSVKGRKEGKYKIKGKAIRPVSKRGSPRKWDWGQCNLEELCEWEQSKEEKNIESKRKLWEICSEWKKKESFFFFAQVVSLNVVISI